MVDIGEVQQALVESGASVVKAARALGVPAAELRKLMARNSALAAVALEAAERDMDRAEQIIRDGMKSQDRMKRLEAAALILKSRFRARRERATKSAVRAFPVGESIGDRPMPNTPNDPKDAPRRDRDEPRTDPSRKGTGPNNPLPGEPGGPTAGVADRTAAEEGQRNERDERDERDNPKQPNPASKR